jgi:hypothetical protein
MANLLFGVLLELVRSGFVPNPNFLPILADSRRNQRSSNARDIRDKTFKVLAI